MGPRTLRRRPFGPCLGAVFSFGVLVFCYLCICDYVVIFLVFLFFMYYDYLFLDLLTGTSSIFVRFWGCLLVSIDVIFFLSFFFGGGGREGEVAVCCGHLRVVGVYWGC